jgi:hypothetical protein
MFPVYDSGELSTLIDRRVFQTQVPMVEGGASSSLLFLEGSGPITWIARAAGAAIKKTAADTVSVLQSVG